MHQSGDATRDAQVQTLSRVRDLLAAAGLRPKHRLGQNFLIDGNLMRLLVREAGITPEQTVLEVGAGTGSLTALLAGQARRVLAVEIDPGLLAVARSQTPAEDVTWLAADALDGPNRLSPELESALVGLEPGPWALVANLPYQIASPLIALLATRSRPPEAMTFMVQAEVADRILAEAGSDAYGPLSVVIQAVCDGRRVRDVPASAFWPPPQVGSTIVRLVPDAARLAAIGDVAALRRLVRLLFSSRRKTIRAVLKRADLAADERKRIESALAAAEVSGDRRAEELTVAQFAAASKALSSRAPRLDVDDDSPQVGDSLS